MGSITDFLHITTRNRAFALVRRKQLSSELGLFRSR
jgi:hypothetical protein